MTYIYMRVFYGENFRWIICTIAERYRNLMFTAVKFNETTFHHVSMHFKQLGNKNDNSVVTNSFAI